MRSQISKCYRTSHKLIRRLAPMCQCCWKAQVFVQDWFTECLGWESSHWLFALLCLELGSLLFGRGILEDTSAARAVAGRQVWPPALPRGQFSMALAVEMGAQFPDFGGSSMEQGGIQRKKKANTQFFSGRRHPAPSLEATAVCRTVLLVTMLLTAYLRHQKMNDMWKRRKQDVVKGGKYQIEIHLA